MGKISLFLTLLTISLLSEPCFAGTERLSQTIKTAQEAWGNLATTPRLTQALIGGLVLSGAGYTMRQKRISTEPDPASLSDVLKAVGKITTFDIGIATGLIISTFSSLLLAKRGITALWRRNN